MTLSEKLELDLQEDDFVELLAVQQGEITKEDLMEWRPKERTKGEQREDNPYSALDSGYKFFPVPR